MSHVIWDNYRKLALIAATRSLGHVRFRDALEAEQTLFNYIEVYFNRRRKHSTNGYKAPALFEEEWWSERKTA
ncbi:IS3 family transposase [Desulfopila sp. IMCC35008]|uniref:IS3 family transposase n=1 Tax=Desulfopila sp. IMCC35008 TaxID=2653858 RepID=UPI0035167D72